MDRQARVDYRSVALDTGVHDGTVTTADGVEFGSPRGVRVYVDPFRAEPVRQRFAQTSWVSAETELGFAFGQLVPTWHARTPQASWVEVVARTRSTRSRRWTRWLVLARWADHDSTVHATSVPGQPPDGASVATDTILTPEGADAWQLKITLLRSEDADGGGPVLTYVGAMASRVPPSPGVTSETGPATGSVLPVPALSQRVHAGHRPEWGGGGDVWCSPTSVAMLLAFWGREPAPDALSWVPVDLPDRTVYHVVRHCWDYAYAGAGNWSFNAAYAARFGLRTFVTRLRTLTEAEEFIAAGIPLVASLRVDPAELDGADYESTGHLVVVAGFTPAGDVVVNDPAAHDPATVSRVYRRDQFERAWRTGSGGIVYIIHPPAVPLPRRPAEPNW